MKGKRAYRIFAMVAVLFGLGVCAKALINPNFTPIHLVKQSGVIAEVRFDFPIKDHKLTGKLNFLKGKSENKTFKFDFSTGMEDQVRYVEKEIVEPAGDTPALLFIGKDQEDTEEGTEEDTSDDAYAIENGQSVEFETEELGASKALLHTSGQWLIFYQNKEGVWEFDKLDASMTSLQATWAGATEMLNECVRYILEDPYANVPVRAGAEWAPAQQVGKVSGKAHGAGLVELSPGKPYLHVAAESGDRLYSADEGDDYKDLTSSHKLEAASFVYAWGDLNGDKRIDLLSWDGKALSIHEQGSKGVFTKKPVKDVTLKDGCIGLTIMDIGQPGKPGVLINTGNVPELWTPSDGKRRKISDKDFEGGEMGKAGRCIVADLDNDTVPDILQMMENGSLFYKGSSPGKFKEPRVSNAALGQGKSWAFLGDYDHDLRFDVFTVNETSKQLWNNQGEAKFAGTVGWAGELAYIGQPGGIDGMTGDINNDGRQDILMAYSHQAPHLFFNRGFRSFGHAHMLDVAENSLLVPSEKGQQAGCLADLNGDGGQDMVLVLKNGEVW
ncbi:MAG: FG-GAP repeat domain-containing protein, partial [Verrucomicrobiota bacterium]